LIDPIGLNFIGRFGGSPGIGEVELIPPRCHQFHPWGTESIQGLTKLPLLCP